MLLRRHARTIESSACEYQARASTSGFRVRSSGSLPRHMKPLMAMMRKEFIHIRRDPQLIGFVLGLPVLLLILFGYALRLRVDNVVVAVWDQDHTFFSVQVKDQLQQNGQFHVEEVDSEEA